MSDLRKYNFYAAYTQAYELFGTELSNDTFETYGITAWNKINNRTSRMYKIHMQPEKHPDYGWAVTLPCNVDIIESVTATYEDYQKTSSTTLFPGRISLPNENYNEYIKYGNNDLYQSGKLIKYRQVDNMLIFTEEYIAVNILYKGIYVDDDGLPFLNDKEVHAIATYCAYADMYKSGLKTKDSPTIQLAMALKQDWNKACNQARVPKYINQNEMSEILNANVSWNRKQYNKSYKPF